MASWPSGSGTRCRSPLKVAARLNTASAFTAEAGTHGGSKRTACCLTNRNLRTDNRAQTQTPKFDPHRVGTSALSLSPTHSHTQCILRRDSWENIAVIRQRYTYRPAVPARRPGRSFAVRFRLPTHVPTAVLARSPRVVFLFPFPHEMSLTGHPPSPDPLQWHWCPTHAPLQRPTSSDVSLCRMVVH